MAQNTPSTKERLTKALSHLRATIHDFIFPTTGEVVFPEVESLESRSVASSHASEKKKKNVQDALGVTMGTTGPDLAVDLRKDFQKLPRRPVLYEDNEEIRRKREERERKRE